MIEQIFGFFLGSVEGLASIVLLLSLGRWARKGAMVGDIFKEGGAFLILLALLTVSGVVDLNPDVFMGLVSTGFDLLSGFIPL